MVLLFLVLKGCSYLPVKNIVYPSPTGQMLEEQKQVYMVIDALIRDYKAKKSYLNK